MSKTPSPSVQRLLICTWRHTQNDLYFGTGGSNLEVLKTTTNSNTNIYHPNTTIEDDVCLLCVLFNSTLESLPLQLCSQPLTSNSFAIDRLGNLPGRSCALDLITTLFFL
jgi:hypothetical protein